MGVGCASTNGVNRGVAEVLVVGVGAAELSVNGVKERDREEGFKLDRGVGVGGTTLTRSWLEEP